MKINGMTVREIVDREFKHGSHKYIYTAMKVIAECSGLAEGTINAHYYEEGVKPEIKIIKLKERIAILEIRKNEINKQIIDKESQITLLKMEKEE